MRANQRREEEQESDSTVFNKHQLRNKDLKKGRKKKLSE
jgi:hypothetical protein